MTNNEMPGFDQCEDRPLHRKAKLALLEKPARLNDVDFDSSTVHKCPECGFVFGPGCDDIKIEVKKK